MSNLKARIGKLEKQTGADKLEQGFLIVVVGDVKDGDSIQAYKEAAATKVEAAKVEYLAEHPEYKDGCLNIFKVTSQECKENLLSIMARGGI